MRFDRVIIAVIVASTVLGTGASLAQLGPFLTGTFPDVPGSHAAFDAIEYAYEKGIVSGYPDGTFRPDDTVNRAEFSKIIVAALYDPRLIDNCFATAPPGTMFSPSLVFPDVARHFWYAKYLCIAKVGDIIGGYPDGTFRADRTINMAEAGKILALSFRLTMEEPRTDDALWYKPYIEALALEHAIPVSVRSIGDQITRAEMVEMIYRLKEGITTKASKTFEEIASGSVGNCSGEEGIFDNLNEALARPGEVCALLLGPDAQVLGDAALEELPAQIGLMRNMRVLDLSGNELRALPGEIGDLAALEELHLRGNRLSQLPTALGGLRNLKVLDLGQNDFAVFPPPALELIGLQKLHLEGNAITAIPDGIRNLTALRTLSMNGNPLSALGAGVFTLKDLRELFIDGGTFASLSGDVAKLLSLEKLDVGSALVSIPTEIGKMANLRILDLSNNELTSLPIEIGNLTDLVELHLSGNPLSAETVRAIRTLLPRTAITFEEGA